MSVSQISTRRNTATTSTDEVRDQVQPPDDLPPLHRLRRKLHWYQIFAIGISGVVGFGIFHDSAVILQIAGPAATLTGFAFVWLVAVAVMEGIGELVTLWPVPNAFVVYVHEFVDPDLANITGFLYWLVYALGTQDLIIAAATVVDYWGESDMIKGLVFFVGAPVGLLAINLFGVQVYGWVEFIAGCLKVILFIVCFALSLALNFGDIGDIGPIHGKYIDDEWDYNSNVVHGSLVGLSVAISLAVFSFVGVELTAITASEAIDRRQLRQPMRLIAWIVGAVYFVGLAAFVSNIKWCDSVLPRLWDQLPPSNHSCPEQENHKRSIEYSSRKGYGNSIVVIAMSNARASSVAGYLNSSLVVFLLSTANTALYVSSRTLFGLTRELKPASEPNKYLKFLKMVLQKLGTSHGKRKVPSWALVVSWAVFCWLPFLTFGANQDPFKYQQIIAYQCAVACLIVWASQCLAFIRYCNWLWKFRENLKKQSNGPYGDYWRYNRWDPRRTTPNTDQQDSGRRLESERAPVGSWLASGQPLVAWFGLCACLVIILGLSTATWWNGHVTVTRGVSVFLIPLLTMSMWISCKIMRKVGLWEQINEGKLWKPKPVRWAVLADILDNMTESAIDSFKPQPEDEERSTL